MEQKSKNEKGHTVEHVTLDGVELVLAPMSGDANETHVERIFAAFAAIDQGEKPAVIIATTTPTM